jgi:hypothetical protein
VCPIAPVALRYHRSVLASSEQSTTETERASNIPLDNRRTTRLLTASLFVICVVAIPTTLVALSVREQKKLSLFDETQHIDYLDRIEHFHLPRFGDRVGPLAMSEAACRSIDWPGVQLPPCTPGQPYDATLFPANGYQYQAHQPPLYYIVTAPFAKVTEHVLDIDPVSAARLVGALWLVSGLTVLWVAMSEIGATPGRRAVLCLLIGCTPASINLASVVSNDAPSVLIGACLALLCVRARAWTHATRSQVAICGAVGLGAALIKPMTGFAVVAGALFLVYLAARKTIAVERNRSLRRFAPALALTAGCLIGIATWVIVYRQIAYESYGKIYDIVEGFLKVDRLTIGDVTEGLPVLLNAPLDVPLAQVAAIAPWANIARYVLLSFGVGYLWRRRDEGSVLGSVALGVLVVGGPTLAVISYVQLQVAHHLPARYGLASFALLAIAGAALPRSRITTAVLWSAALPLVWSTYSFFLA